MPTRKTNNARIRERAQTQKVFFWELAERLKMCDNAFYKMMRHELPDDEQTRIVKIIDSIAAEREK